jgi:tRNA pseudouridine55 synthase
VTIHSLIVESFEPPLLHLRIDCSKGTYIRSLAHDIGTRLGTGATLAVLRRTRVGGFGSPEAITTERLADMEGEEWQEHLVAADEVLTRWPAVIAGEENARMICTGRSPEWRTSGVEDRCRAYSADGSFLAVLARDAQGAWRPEKVFSA